MIQQLILILIMAIAYNDAPDNSKIIDEREHKVIIQVSTANHDEQKVVVNQVRNTLNALPNAKVKVVLHSQGLPLVVAGQSRVMEQVKELLERGVIFAACENTMKKKGLEKSDLLPGVTTVPSAMAELVLRQEEGWTYIKAGI